MWWYSNNDKEKDCIYHSELPNWLIINVNIQLNNFYRAHNNFRTLLYLPWDKNSYSTSFKSQKFLILSAKRCVNIVNITKNIDSRTQIAL